MNKLFLSPLILISLLCSCSADAPIPKNIIANSSPATSNPATVVTETPATPAPAIVQLPEISELVQNSWLWLDYASPNSAVLDMVDLQIFSAAADKTAAADTAFAYKLSRYSFVDNSEQAVSDKEKPSRYFDIASMQEWQASKYYSAYSMRLTAATDHIELDYVDTDGSIAFTQSYALTNFKTIKFAGEKAEQLLAKLLELNKFKDYQAFIDRLDFKTMPAASFIITFTATPKNTYDYLIDNNQPKPDAFTGSQTIENVSKNITKLAINAAVSQATINDSDTVDLTKINDAQAYSFTYQGQQYFMALDDTGELFTGKMRASTEHVLISQPALSFLITELKAKKEELMPAK